MTPKEIEKILGIDIKASVIHQLTHPVLNDFKILLSVKRDDLLHPIISGNKWRKLKYNLSHVLNNKYKAINSMGGYYSNHLHALAYAGHKLGIPTSAYIRGEKPVNQNHTLQEIQDWGMQLTFIERNKFRLLRNNHPADENIFWLPEGAANNHAVRGVSEIIDEIDIDYDAVAVACGSGTTLAGLISASNTNQIMLGISALKDDGYLKNEISSVLSRLDISVGTNWEINSNYHFGGFAKTNNKLARFAKEFEDLNSIKLDKVYNAKLFYALIELVTSGKFKTGQHILAIHTGGLQGNREFI